MIVIIIVIVMIVMNQPPGFQMTNWGKTFYLSRAKVEKSLLNIAPQRVTKYGLALHGREYPVRQVIAIATGTPMIEWSTTNAYRILQKLGFKIRIHG
jgi:5-methylcytosine-specific restriction protein B